jgi:hypothetical protein
MSGQGVSYHVEQFGAVSISGLANGAVHPGETDVVTCVELIQYGTVIVLPGPLKLAHGLPETNIAQFDAVIGKTIFGLVYELVHGCLMFGDTIIEDTAVACLGMKALNLSLALQ